MAQLKVASKISSQHSPVVEKAVPVNVFNANSVVLLKPVFIMLRYILAHGSIRCFMITRH